MSARHRKHNRATPTGSGASTPTSETAPTSTERRYIGAEMNEKNLLEALVATATLPRMNILQCQEAAKQLGFDSAEFYLCGPRGRVKCKWLDAYFGMFMVDGATGFNMASQFQFAPDVWCEGLGAPEARAEGTPRAGSDGDHNPTPDATEGRSETRRA